MGTEQLAVFRGPVGRPSPTPAKTSMAQRLDDEARTPHPLSTLALAASIRLDDPRQEHERVVMLEVAIVVGREAARALDQWLSQSLAEYRGSRSTWDLAATTAEFRLKMDQFDEILHDTADRLIALIPELTHQPAFVPTPAPRPSRRVLDEVTIVSKLLTAIGPQVHAPGRLVADRTGSKR